MDTFKILLNFKRGWGQIVGDKDDFSIYKKAAFMFNKGL